MKSQVRVVGSSYTTFVWNGGANGQGQTLAWLDDVTDSGQAAIGGGQGSGGPGYETVTPLGYQTAQDIVTSRVLAPGTLKATIRELWNEPAWRQLSGLANTNNIIDIFQYMSSLTNPITCQMIIKPVTSPLWRGWTYENCTIVGIADGETVEIGALSMQRAVTILYTHRSYFWSAGTPST